MVTNNHSFEEQVRRSLAGIQSELLSREAQRDTLNDEIEKLRSTKQAYELVLQRESKLAGKEHTLGVDWHNTLKGKKREHQLMEIAKRKDGRLKVSEVTDILFTTGLIKSKKRQNAYAVIYGNLLGMVNKGLIEKTDAGEFRITKKPDLRFSVTPTQKRF